MPGMSAIAIAIQESAHRKSCRCQHLNRHSGLSSIILNIPYFGVSAI
jgi:hypothetical protein